MKKRISKLEFVVESLENVRTKFERAGKRNQKF